MKIDRRSWLAGASALSASTIACAATPFVPMGGARCRVLLVNDFSGDIDGLFSAVHAILSPSIELRGLIGTRTMNKEETAARSVELCREILTLMKRTLPVFAGSETLLAKRGEPLRSPGAQAIIDEARRTDSALPLFVAVGGGLTEVASALMIAPDIASRLTLVWIGGDALPYGGKDESNFITDPIAAQFIYNESEVKIWQVPRDVYKTCQVSAHELQAWVAPHGTIGKWLYQKVVDAPKPWGGRFNMGATWALGDNPLVLLTALTGWVPSEYMGGKLEYERTDSSYYDVVTAPLLNADGTFALRSEGRKIRIYKSVDVRMMLADFFAKMRVNYGR